MYFLQFARIEIFENFSKLLKLHKVLEGALFRCSEGGGGKGSPKATISNPDRHCWPTLTRSGRWRVRANNKKRSAYSGFSVGGLPKKALTDEERQNFV